MTHPPKLLYVINHMDWFWSHRLKLAQGARDAGYQVSVAATDAGRSEELPRYDFRGIELPRASLRTLPSFLIALAGTIRRERPNIVHAITLKHAFLTGLAARFCPGGTRYIFTIAGLGYLFSGDGWRPAALRALLGPLLRFSLRSPAVTVIFQNPDDMNLLLARGYADPSRAVLIPGSGVDTDEFPFSPEPHAETPLVLMASRLVRDKGVAVFAEAARRLRTRGVKARFVLAGGIDRINPNAMTGEEIEALVAADDALEWRGKVTDMAALYAESTLVVYPSWYREGVPKVLLEAASTGRAIVTTDHPGCREAVRDGENGLLVPVKNAKAVADAVESLLADPARRAAMGRRGRERAETEFSSIIIVNRTLDVYKGRE